MLQALEGDFTGFMFKSDAEQAPELEMGTTNTEPQRKSMEVESQSKFEWLCNKTLWVSDFEITFDGLVGDGQSMITFSKNKEMCCAVKQNFTLMQTTCICSALHTPERIQRKF